MAQKTLPWAFSGCDVIASLSRFALLSERRNADVIRDVAGAGDEHHPVWEQGRMHSVMRLCGQATWRPSIAVDEDSGLWRGCQI